MRKELFAFLTLSAIVGMQPVAASAQQWQVSLGAGPSIPIARLGEEAETGYHVQGSVGYQLPSIPAGLRLDLFYQDFDAVEREPGIFVSNGGEWYRQLSAIMNFTISSPTSIGFLQPYGLIGGGYMREWHDDRTYSGKKQNTLNFNAGGGVEFPVFGSEGFLEVRLLNIFPGDALETGPPAVYPEVQFKSIPVTLGVRL